MSGTKLKRIIRVEKNHTDNCQNLPPGLLSLGFRIENEAVPVVKVLDGVDSGKPSLLEQCGRLLAQDLVDLGEPLAFRRQEDMGPVRYRPVEYQGVLIWDEKGQCRLI